MISRSLLLLVGSTSKILSRSVEAGERWIGVIGGSLILLLVMILTLFMCSNLSFCYQLGFCTGFSLAVTPSEVCPNAENDEALDDKGHDENYICFSVGKERVRVWKRTIKMRIGSNKRMNARGDFMFVDLLLPIDVARRDCSHLVDSIHLVDRPTKIFEDPPTACSICRSQY